MLVATEKARAASKGNEVLEGFTGTSNQIMPLTNQTVEAGMAFMFIVNANGKLDVFREAIRGGGQIPKRNADGTPVRDDNGNIIMEDNKPQYCLVKVWDREYELDADGNKILDKPKGPWTPVMEENQTTGKMEQQVRRWYPGATQRGIIPVKVGKITNADGQEIEDPNNIIASLPRVTAQGSFVQKVQAANDINSVIYDTMKSAGIDPTVETTDEMLNNATKLISYEVIGRFWTRNPQARMDPNAPKARRQPVGKFDIVDK